MCMRCGPTCFRERLRVQTELEARRRCHGSNDVPGVQEGVHGLDGRQWRENNLELARRALGVDLLDEDIHRFQRPGNVGEEFGDLLI